MKNGKLLLLLGAIPAIWLGLLTAPYLSEGLPGILEGLPVAMQEPYKIVWCEDSGKAALLFLALYGMGVGIYLSTRRHYRKGEEHGSAKWGDVREINKKYRDPDFFQNRIFTQNFRMGLDGKKHQRTLHVVAIGGSGAGKTRRYVKPNLMQANISFVALDPKGELLRDTGFLLKEKGYEVRVLDLLNMEKSHCYNPFVYLRDANDAQRLVTNLLNPPPQKGASPRTLSGTRRPVCCCLPWFFTCITKHPRRNRISPWLWKCSGPVKCGRTMKPMSPLWTSCSTVWKCGTLTTLP